MYSLVLMTAMTTGPTTPEFNGYFRDLFHGCNGCNGCQGSSSAAPAYNCGGCNGCQGGWFSDFRSRVRRFFDSPSGCCGGSGSGYGCTGSGYGCSGTAYTAGCWGSSAYSCFGSPSYSCYGSSSLSCFGGPPVAIPTPEFAPSPANPAGPPRTIPLAPPEVAPPSSDLNAGVRPAGHNTSALVSSGSAARATVVIRLPIDAKLYAGDRPLALTGAERRFVTPALPAGQEYGYRFRAEYERGGETVSVAKKVNVKAGATVEIEFADLTAAKSPPAKDADKGGERRGPGTSVAATPTGTSGPVVPSAAPAVAKSDAPAAGGAAERATITVKLPPGAALFVDGRESPSKESNRVFTTPPLPTGRQYSYQITAEVVRNGQKETFSQKVPFRAGERVEVDFTAGR